jgi:hypothetical protein
MNAMTSKALTASVVDLLPQADLGRRMREVLADVVTFLAAASAGLEASRRYELLTARGVASPQAARRVFSQHLAR